MKSNSLFINKTIFQAILSGGYTPLDLREFVQLCHDLALPIIRKKIALGKLHLSSIGLTEADVVYDCIADLFQRDENGAFTQIRTFYDKHLGNINEPSEEELVVTLRHLIFGKINNNIVRLYSETDPALGKILRNLKLALERSNLFQEVQRFGDMYIVPRNIDPLFHLPPIQIDVIRQEFSRTVLVHDSVPEMLKKLHNVISMQDGFQRAVSLVSVAVLFKEIYNLGGDTETVTNVVEDQMEAENLTKIVEEVCNRLRNEMYQSYVEKGKCSQEIFNRYIFAVNEILRESFADEHLDGATYYQYLRVQISGLTKEEYLRTHRAILEYLAKKGRERLKTLLKTL